MKRNKRQQSHKNSPSPQYIRSAQDVNPVPSEELILQFGENEITAKAISEKVRQDYKENGGEQISDVKIYVKPEDNKAYYVVNQETEGSVDLV